MTQAFATEQAKTRALFDAILNDDSKWTPKSQMIANVFKAFYTRSFTVDQISLVARVVDGMREDCDLTSELDKLVKAKVLRRRTHRGVRLYEVNY